MVLFLCSCGFLDAVFWARCLFAHPFICSFIPSFIIVCVLSTCCADAVLISGEREKSMTGTAPDLMDLTSSCCLPTEDRPSHRSSESHSGGSARERPAGSS